MQSLNAKFDELFPIINICLVPGYILVILYSLY